MMTEDQHDLVDFINQEIDKWDDERRYVLVLEIALAALTQPASPALKLPDERVDSGVNGRLYHNEGWNACLAEVKRLNAPHTAPIEPICATGGADWVKVSDVEIEQELISLQSGNGQLRGESFYQEALKELLALRKTFSEPYGYTDKDDYGMVYEPRHKERLRNPTPLYRKP
jgi:hypothetical protein